MTSSEVSTNATSWGPPETRTVYRDGGRIGAIVCEGGIWKTLWVISTPKNNDAMALRLALMNQEMRK